MPLYEYKCNSCGDVFEIIQKFSDQPLAVHENCGGIVERLISTSALQFKGSGWYVNDYGKGNSKAPKAGGANGDSKGEGKSDKSNGSPASSESSSKTESSSKSESSSKPDSSPKKTPVSSSKSDSK
jgi:putative FmdB family regulatory protein